MEKEKKQAKYRYIGPGYDKGIIVGTQILRPKEWSDKEIKDNMAGTNATLISAWFIPNEQ